MAAAGTATIDFGVTPTDEGSVTVTGQTDLQITDHVEAWVMRDSTVDNPVEAHSALAEDINLICEQDAANDRFFIYARTGAKVTGTFKVRWAYAGDAAIASNANILPVAQMSRVATQSVSSGAEPAVDWDTEDFDTEGIADTTTNRFTVPAGRAGIWIASIRPVWGNTGVSNHHTTLNKNGGLWARVKTDGQTISHMPVVTILVDAAVGDFWEWLVRQDSGSAQNFIGSAMFAFMGRRV